MKNYEKPNIYIVETKLTDILTQSLDKDNDGLDQTWDLQ